MKHLEKIYNYWSVSSYKVFINKILLDIDYDAGRIMRESQLLPHLMKYVTLKVRDNQKAHLYIHVKPFVTWSIIKENFEKMLTEKKTYVMQKLFNLISTSMFSLSHIAALNEAIFTVIKTKLVKAFSSDPMMIHDSQGISQVHEGLFYETVKRAEDEISLYDLAKIVLEPKDLAKVMFLFLTFLDDITLDKRIIPFYRKRAEASIYKKITVTKEDLKLILEKLVKYGVYQKGNRYLIWLCLNGIAYRYITSNSDKRYQLFQELVEIVKDIDEEWKQRPTVAKYDDDKPTRNRYGFPKLIEIISFARIDESKILGHLGYEQVESETPMSIRKVSYENKKRLSKREVIGFVAYYILEMFSQKNYIDLPNGDYKLCIKPKDLKQAYMDFRSVTATSFNTHVYLKELKKFGLIKEIKRKGFSRNIVYEVILTFDQIDNMRKLLVIDIETQLPFVFCKDNVKKTFDSFGNVFNNKYRNALTKLIMLYFRALQGQVDVDMFLKTVKAIAKVDHYESKLGKYFETFTQRVDMLRFRLRIEKQDNGQYKTLTSLKKESKLLGFKTPNALMNSKKQIETFFKFIRLTNIDYCYSLCESLWFESNKLKIA